ncbi:hypothetical protein M9Y10_045528 [Tritrichomonas musculus]|uniref:DUF3447 domain-containing protein n=1 Tax=Tritrichomonas musculus TaxID=1915356 RepID=A0ABR2JVI2_9EUKA
MDLFQYFDDLKDIQNILLDYIDDLGDSEDICQNLIQITNNFNFSIGISQFKIFIYILSAISANHHRDSTFFSKIYKIINYFRDDIQKYFTSSEIFDFFKENKPIILYLIDEKIITLDDQLLKIMKNDPYFFSPESSIDNQEYFEEKRRIGENDSYICSLIRQDSIVEFVVYVNQTNLSLSKTLKKSIFETNSFLMNKETTIFEYSAFFGSIQIFNYLLLNKVTPTPSLWMYAIHSNNPEMIYAIERLQIKPEDPSYEECLIESIKCHHNDIANYIKNNLMNEDDLEFKANYVFDNNFNKHCYCYYNFSLLDLNAIDHKFNFFYWCEFGFFNLVKFYVENKKVDLYETVILNSKIE